MLPMMKEDIDKKDWTSIKWERSGLLRSGILLKSLCCLHIFPERIAAKIHQTVSFLKLISQILYFVSLLVALMMK